MTRNFSLLPSLPRTMFRCLRWKSWRWGPVCGSEGDWVNWAVVTAAQHRTKDPGTPWGWLGKPTQCLPQSSLPRPQALPTSAASPQPPNHNSLFRNFSSETRLSRRNKEPGTKIRQVKKGVVCGYIQEGRPRSGSQPPLKDDVQPGRTPQRPASRGPSALLKDPCIFLQSRSGGTEPLSWFLGPVHLAIWGARWLPGAWGLGLHGPLPP